MKVPFVVTTVTELDADKRTVFESRATRLLCPPSPLSTWRHSPLVLGQVSRDILRWFTSSPVLNITDWLLDVIINTCMTHVTQ
ncbi:hypothetical protein RRG08_054136 [Elysia crispata]|uniref:Uncharacterized protein n=1 Tax=Elysia crispata TaxID=231223 RepID=A0AAE0Y7E7_9GAST|nr:hypothetical protein RRG08_054136 [Elysia crispata]